jgi:hypothetical protein
MQIIRKSHHIRIECYGLCFDWKDEPGSGFSFPCTQDGTLLVEELSPIARDNYAKCMSGEYEVTPQGVKDYSYLYFEHAQGRCECGGVVDLYGFTNTCDCGLEYNSGGQLLAPRSQWAG